MMTGSAAPILESEPDATGAQKRYGRPVPTL